MKPPTLLGNSRKTDSPPAAKSAEFLFRLAPPTAAFALLSRALLIAGIGMAVLAHARAQRPDRTARPFIAERNPYVSAEDVELGRKLYAGRCGHCHGQSGEGGRGAVLNTGRFRHGGSDRELFATIRNGIPGTEMPGTLSLPEAEVWRMTAYVKRLGARGAVEPARGDAAAGAVVYGRNGCASCHAIGGDGGSLGPDLTDIGSKRAARHLRESIVNPNADIPLDYRSVSVTTAHGKTVAGIHLNEDEYSVQLRDMKGDPVSFRKSELKEVRLPRQSPMPAYASLSETELENLVAHLSSLKPKP